MEKLSKKQITSIVITLIGIIVVAVLGSIFVNLGMEWFDLLRKPSQWIPNIAIPIVWSVIYLTFAVILFLWQTKKPINKKVVGLLIVNGIFNVLWCLVFFTLHQTFLGLIVIVLNLILANILVFNIVKEKYALILFIYPVWISLATCLNLALWILN